MDFSRNWLFINDKEQNKLAQVTVLFAGCGLGSYIAASLARFGVKNFIIADGDTVSESNLNRQYFNHYHIGRNKAECLKDQLLLINPQINVQVISKFLNRKDLEELIPQCDIVVNAIDFDSEAFITCNSLSKEHKKVEIFSVNLGFGAITLVFNEKTPDLMTFFTEDDVIRLKGKMIDWIVYNHSNHYFVDKYEKYKRFKTLDFPEPQMITGAALNSAINCRIVYQFVHDPEIIEVFPKVYKIFI